ncbi:hypothetical protein HPB47_014503, partial [Ixodes persulcatus]
TPPQRNAIENEIAGLPISGPGPVGVPLVIVGHDAFPLSARRFHTRTRCSVRCVCGRRAKDGFPHLGNNRRQFCLTVHLER